MSSEDVRTIAGTYFDAWRGHDFERLRSILADDVTFRGPLGAADGADACVVGLRGMAEKVMTDVVVHTMAVDGPDVLTWFDLHNQVVEPLPTVNWSHIENGLITRIRVTFDPRPLFPPEADS
jgi:SnoaL-like domain